MMWAVALGLSCRGKSPDHIERSRWLHQGEHWRLVAVELGRGRVLCLRRAADRGYGGNTVPSAETAPDSL